MSKRYHRERRKGKEGETNYETNIGMSAQPRVEADVYMATMVKGLHFEDGIEVRAGLSVIEEGYLSDGYAGLLGVPAQVGQELCVTFGLPQTFK